MDQFGNTWHGLEFPRKELMEILNNQHVEKMYVDRNGKAQHTGYVIGRHLVDIYQVHDWKQKGGVDNKGQITKWVNRSKHLWQMWSAVTEKEAKEEYGKCVADTERLASFFEGQYVMAKMCKDLMKGE